MNGKPCGSLLSKKGRVSSSEVTIDVDDSDIGVVEEGVGTELKMGDKFSNRCIYCQSRRNSAWNLVDSRLRCRQAG